MESVKRRFEKVYCLCNNDGRPARSVARKRLYCKRRQVKNVLRRTLDLWLADNLSSLTFRRDWPIGTMMWSMQLFSGRTWRPASAQLSNKFGFCPSGTVSIVSTFKNTTAYQLGWLEPSSSPTKELHGSSISWHDTNPMRNYIRRWHCSGQSY